MRERHLAATDELTGARRRGVGLEDIEREIERVRRTGGTLVAVFADVDHLKAVNDGFGHSAGDKVLRDVVASLRNHLRSYDLVIRLGGDEFLCVLADVALADVRSRFEHVNAALRGHPGHSSISVGFGELRDGDTVADLIERADRDLLQTRAR